MYICIHIYIYRYAMLCDMIQQYDANWCRTTYYDVQYYDT